MALGNGDVPQAGDETSQTIVAYAYVGNTQIPVYDNAADENQMAYNELVPPTYQPLADPITTDYLGRPRA